MRIVKRSLPANHEVILAGDFHVGARNCSYSAIDEIVEYVRAKPNRYLVGMGDWAEAIHITDKRFDLGSHTFPNSNTPVMVPLKQYQLVQDKLEPIKNRIIGLLSGNHDDKLHKYGDFVEATCDYLGTEYLTYSSKVHINVGDSLAYKMFVWHGYGVANSRAKDRLQRIANTRASIKRKLDGTGHQDCEVLAMGHIHKLHCFKNPEQVQLYDDGEKIRATTLDVPTVQTKDGKRRWVHPDNRIYCVTGTTLKTLGDGYSTYAERRGYEPAPLGFISIKYNNGNLTGQPHLCGEGEEDDFVLPEIRTNLMDAVNVNLTRGELEAEVEEAETSAA